MRRLNLPLSLFAGALLALLLGTARWAVGGAPAPTDASITAANLTYDIVYVRQPRAGDHSPTVWPEVFHPGQVEPGSDLMLLHPDGSEEVLVAAGDGAVTDPFVANDGRSVYYSFFHDVRPAQLNPQRGNLPYRGSDIYRIDLGTRRVQQLTFQEFTPNTGAGRWLESNPVDPPEGYNRLGYGILNMGPAPLPGNQLIFVSNRNGFVPNKNFTLPTMQLFVMDTDGSNVTAIAPMTISSALHPTPLRDGRVAFSNYEAQGLRDERLWGIWAIWPDGTLWEPIVSAFKHPQAFHFMTQLSNDDLVVEDYYNLSNSGFGALYRFPVNASGGGPRFHGAFLDQNPAIEETTGAGILAPFRMAFTPRGMISLTPFTHANDEAAPMGPNGMRMGKFTQPSAAPRNDLLVVWSPGAVNSVDRAKDEPAIDSGIYLIPEAAPIRSPAGLRLIKNDPAYNEAWPRAAVSYGAVHGGDRQPYHFPWLPNEGDEHVELPAGTPYGLIGTSSFYHRESFPGFSAPNAGFDGLDAFNTSENDQSSNWAWQGADAGRYSNDDIWAVRLVAQETNSHRSYGPHSGQHFFNHINEKLRILGEIPLRKPDQDGRPQLDGAGDPDTSFLAKLPADTPFTFQMLDRNGMVLTMAQTWHQVRPGEMRTDCGGCHAHSQRPTHFVSTAAAQPDYQPWDLTRSRPLLTRDDAGNPALRTVEGGAVNVEFYSDVRPILQRSCASCHSQKQKEVPGNLVLDDLSLVPGPQFSGQRLPGDFARLCFDREARWGYPPLVKVGGQPAWRQSNASRYVRLFQSRRSLLIWKVFGKRLDGWSNADHPTEAVPGDVATLPPGAEADQADLDYSGTIMPPPDSGVPGLSEDEKLTLARWVDLGCPINEGQGTENEAFGWFLDDVRPTLTVSSPRPGMRRQPLDFIRIGVADAYSGIQAGSLSVKADLSLLGRPAGTELADLAQPAGDGIYMIPIPTGLRGASNANLSVAVADQQGNITRVRVTFSVHSYRAYLPQLQR